MKKLTANKSIIAAIAIFILLMILYKVLFGNDDALIPDELAASSIGDDVIKLHEDLRKVALDQALFSSPSYLGLTDFSVPIPRLPVGRPNPFEVIGQD